MVGSRIVAITDATPKGCGVDTRPAVRSHQAPSGPAALSPKKTREPKWSPTLDASARVPSLWCSSKLLPRRPALQPPCAVAAGPRHVTLRRPNRSEQSNAM